MAEPVSAADCSVLGRTSHGRALGGVFWGLVASQAAIYVLVAVLSRHFDFHAPVQDRPLLLILALFIAAFGLHLASLAFALREPSSRGLSARIVLAAIVYRGILLPSLPIQEIDIYRYMWDGAAVAAGVNPYRYSPRQVQEADRRADLPDDLRRLTVLCDDSASLDETLRRVHFDELTTVYPPITQAVFGAATACTPTMATVWHRTTVMKGALTAFDLATLLLVVGLLRVSGRHAGWSIVYGWSPLVLKEFANSGHLDAIAVCLTMAAVYGVAIGFSARSAAEVPHDKPANRRPTIGQCARACLAGLLLGLAVGAKLYPLVLFPWLAAALLRTGGWRPAITGSASALISAALCMWPMLFTPAAKSSWVASRHNAPQEPGDTAAISSPQSAPFEQPGQGLHVFLTRWEMNDLVFMVLVENLKPPTDHTDTQNKNPRQGENPKPWFVILPAAWRLHISAFLSTQLQSTPQDAAFRGARGLTLAIFMAAACALAWRAGRSDALNSALCAAFLTIAWFWALSPTMNPWYWTWALPLLPFARQRAWLAVAGLLFLYYSRFWVRHHFADTAVLGTPYRGEAFFHFVVVPAEHGLWMLWLIAEALIQYRQDRLRP